MEITQPKSKGFPVTESYPPQPQQTSRTASGGLILHPAQHVAPSRELDGLQVGLILAPSPPLLLAWCRCRGWAGLAARGLQNQTRSQGRVLGTAPKRNRAAGNAKLKQPPVGFGFVGLGWEQGLGTAEDSVAESKQQQPHRARKG